MKKAKSKSSSSTSKGSKKKDQEDESSNDFAYINGYSLNSGGIIEELASSNSKLEDENLSRLLALANKANKDKKKKAKKHSYFYNKDGLLYNIGSTIHIINDKKWFK